LTHTGDGGTRLVVTFIFESDQTGQAHYDGLMQAIGRESLDAPTRDGFITRFSGPNPSGAWQVIDVWEFKAEPRLLRSGAVRPRYGGSRQHRDANNTVASAPH